MKKFNKKSYLITEEISKKIKNGQMGDAGNRFVTTRELAIQYHISLGTAQSVMEQLKSQKIIQLIGKTYYLTHDIFCKNAEINQKVTFKKLIGLHMFDFDAYTARIAKSIEYYGWKNGYQVIIASSSFQLEREQEILNMFRENQVSGVITCTGNTKCIEQIYENYPLPVLYFGSKPEGIYGNKIFGDEFIAGTDLAEHLLYQGYKQFAFIGLSKWQVPPRFLGVKAKLEDKGYKISPDRILLLRDINEDLTNKLKKLLSKQNDPIALICFIDDIALNVLKFCRLYDYSVPTQIGISGFDDSIAAENSGITSARVNVDRMAELAIKVLIEQIDSGQKSNHTYSVKGILKSRASTNLKGSLPKYDND